MSITRVGLLLALCLLSRGSNCDGGGGGSTTLTHIPELTVELLNPSTKITNGETKTYTVRITYKDVGIAEDPPSITDTLTLRALTVVPPSDASLTSSSVTVTKGGTLDVPLPLSCNPAGVKGTLGNSGRGSRVCSTGCPPGCSHCTLGPGCLNPCPPKCEDAVGCVDDPVQVLASFHGKDSGTVTVLCMPSTGPTQGTL